MRTSRQPSDLTKKRISDAMKRKHQERTESDKQQTAQKQSDSMRQYWQGIPATNPKTSQNQ